MAPRSVSIQKPHRNAKVFTLTANKDMGVFSSLGLVCYTVCKMPFTVITEQFEALAGL